MLFSRRYILFYSCDSYTVKLACYHSGTDWDCFLPLVSLFVSSWLKRGPGAWEHRTEAVFFPGVYKSVCGQISVNTTASQPCKMQSGNFTGVQSYKLPAPCPAGVPETHIVVGLFFQVFIGLYLCLSGSSSVCSWDDNQDSVPRWVPGLQKNSRFWFQVYHVE